MHAQSNSIRADSFSPVLSGEKRISQHSQTSGFINTYHVSALAEHQLQRSMNESPVSTGAEAVLFNTMVALYVEVNLAY